MKPLHAQITLHATVVVFGFTGVLGKLISLAATPLVFWRTLIGAGGLYLWMLIRRSGGVAMPASLRAGVFGTGFLVAVHWHQRALATDQMGPVHAAGPAIL